MESFILFLIKGNLILAAGMLFYFLGLKKLTTHGANRTYLLSLGLLSILAPLIKLPSKEITAAVFTYDLNEIIVNTQSKSSEFSLNDYFTGFYLLGVILGIAYLSVGIFKLSKQLSAAAIKKVNGLTLYIHPKFEPSSFFRNILLSEYLPTDNQHQIILAHEEAHVKLNHSLDLLFIQFIKILFWFNPLAYLLDKVLREVHEFQADAIVTHKFSSYEYGLLLLERVTSQPLYVLNHFNQFSTKNRIIMMNKPQSSNFQKAVWILTLPLLFGFFAITSIDLKAQVQQVEKTEIQAEEIFDVVDQQPIPDGGMEGWSSYLSSNLKYPEAAKAAGIEGTVYVVFVITNKGEIDNVEILRGIGYGCDEEAMRVIRNAPNWTPGRQNDRAMNVRMRIPVKFKL